MANLKNKSINDIMELLYNNYFSFYYDVYYKYIQEAIEETLKDFRNKSFFTIEDIHKNIKNNYI